MTQDQKRISGLTERFERRFGRTPAVVVRAPGRVNLIGEHTDYNALPVLPIAIERSVLIAAAPRDDRTIVLANVEPAFGDRRYELRESIPAFPGGDWGNYHKAAAQGLLSRLGEGALRGADSLADGNIPPGAGLSSSSAFVVGSALALLAVNDRTMPAAELAELCARAERYVGTLSGGMDQAVCLLARAGHALRIDFDPLRVKAVPVPDGCAFVACHSLVTAEKSGAARAAYNQRVIECRLACHLLERVLGDSLARPLRNLGELTELFPEQPLAAFVLRLQEVVAERALSLDEIARVAGDSVEKVATRAGIDQPSASGYQLLRRARHVLTEAERVNQAEEALRAGDWHGFGVLMDASHASCRDDYEVSCAALDALVAAAKRAGALGARLTGAGFGGCTVNLVPQDLISEFIDHLERDYYRSSAPTRDHCFVFSPCAGGSVLRC